MKIHAFYMTKGCKNNQPSWAKAASKKHLSHQNLPCRASKNSHNEPQRNTLYGPMEKYGVVSWSEYDKHSVMVSILPLE